MGAARVQTPTDTLMAGPWNNMEIVMLAQSQTSEDPSEATVDGFIFLSYSTKDKSLSGKVKSVLTASGFEVFLAHEDLVPSEEWQQEILRALQRCNVFTPLLTENFRGSDWTDQEVGLALARVSHCVILSLMVSPVTSPHAFLKQYQALNLDPKRPEQACCTFVKVIGEKLGISEVRKDRAVQQFVSSSSFAAAQRNVRALFEFDCLSRDQMDRILTAAITNDQVYPAYGVSKALSALVARHETSPELRQRFLQMYHP